MLMRQRGEPRSGGGTVASLQLERGTVKKPISGAYLIFGHDQALDGNHAVAEERHVSVHEMSERRDGEVIDADCLYMRTLPHHPFGTVIRKSHIIRRKLRSTHQTAVGVVCSKQQPCHRGIVRDVKRRQGLRRQRLDPVGFYQQRRAVDDVEGNLVYSGGVRGDEVSGSVYVRACVCVEAELRGVRLVPLLVRLHLSAIPSAQTRRRQPRRQRGGDGGCHVDD